MNKYIDHTLLKPDATRQEIEKLCHEALQHDFAAVCINPCWVELAASICQDTDVKVCTVIGFPLGASTSWMKIEEACDAMDQGAQELDMVINIGLLKSGEYHPVEKEIREIVECAKEQDAIVKVIIETALLTDEEKVMACKLAVNAGAHYVKTSTGFAKSGATVEDIILMRKTVGSRLGVKASGGIRDYATAKAMLDAGATRIGTSSGITIALLNKS